MTARGACALAAVAALAASLGDLLLLWVANAGRIELGLPAPPDGALLIGHQLGVFAIPLYGVGYWGVSRAIGAAHRRAARFVFVTGALGGAYGGVVHGMTGMAEQLERAAGIEPGDPMAFVARLGAFLVPLWIGIAIAITAGSGVFAVAVARGDTALPRWMALASPFALVLLAALLGVPTPIGRALLVPTAPNLAHVWFFALAGLSMRAGLVAHAISPA
jgi:hypothetical protein